MGSDRTKTNESLVNAYGRTLRSIFLEWASGTNLSINLSFMAMALQDQAAVYFPKAFVRGIGQAHGTKEYLTGAEQYWLNAEIELNRQRLSDSFVIDVREILFYNGDTPKGRNIVRQRLASRLENLYGGALWKVIEGGYGLAAQGQGLKVRRNIGEERTPCGPCQDNARIYLPYEPLVFPGTDCRGRTSCRCFYSLLDEIA